MNNTLRFYIAAFVCGGLLLFSSCYTVMEGQKAMVFRLGALVTDNTTGKAKLFNPGIHFKLPVVDHVRRFDVRLQTLDISAADSRSMPRIVTREKKNVVVDYYVKWRIANIALYYQRTLGQPQTLLEQQLNDVLRTEFGRRTINELIADDRAGIMERLKAFANQSTRNLGIDIVDVRIKRVDLPEEVSAAIFDQMRAEREKAASEHRANGKAAAEAIQANADANAAVTVATAKANAAQLRAQGDLAAAKIYADAYSKDPAFYAFYRSLLAYKNTFSSKQDLIIVRPEGQFFKYFKNEPLTHSK